MKFTMDDTEIRTSYNTAKNQAAQVQVLAELNAVPQAVMAEKLRELGCDVPVLQEVKQKPLRAKEVLFDENRARALFDEGLRVPEDISVVGYDGLRIGDFYVPKLTTISQSVELLAKCSFELLISCMQGAPAQHLTVPFRLLRRQSVRQITE